MKNLPKHEIRCWSDIRNEYAPTAHPTFDSPTQAREYGNQHIKHTDFIVQEVH